LRHQLPTYFEQMLESIGAEPLLHNSASAERAGCAPQREFRLLTKFEDRGHKLGHGLWDLVFKGI
jgi:tRNA (guanine-N7-)-methyltransferase